MPDRVASLPDSARRRYLEQIREWEGEVVTASQLRRELPGFKARMGIYKPARSEHALWIRQTKKGVYPDREPEFHPDGSWTYLYSPQSEKGQFDPNLATNRSLEQCRKDRIPVGVFRPAKDVSERTAYRVLGLGYVEGFTGSHFVIRGEPINETADPLPEGVVPPFVPFEFSPTPIEEIVRTLRERRFASVLRELYHEKCSLCGIGFHLRGRPLALEAAHVIPVKRKGVIGDVRNGVLLCSNHHALFDGYAWTFDSSFKVIVTEDREFRTSALANHVLGWEGKRLPNLPTSSANYPAPSAAEWRMAEFIKYQ